MYCTVRTCSLPSCRLNTCFSRISPGGAASTKYAFTHECPAPPGLLVARTTGTIFRLFTARTRVRR